MVDHPSAPSVPQPPRAVVAFDLDGTLVDASPDLAVAVNQARETLGLGPLPREVVRSYVGDGARKLVQRSLPEEVAAEAFDAAFAEFYRCYETVCTRETRAYAGMPELVADLGRQPQVAVAVCTNKPERMTRLILAHYGFAPVVRMVVAGDTLPTRKPDPAGLTHIATALGVPRQRLMLVGDSPVDARTAEAAGCELALVEWGFSRPEALAPFAPRIRAPHADALRHGLQQWIAQCCEREAM